MNVKATTITVSALPLDTDRFRNFWLRVQRFDDTGRWYIEHCGEYLTAAGEWTPDKALAVRADRETALQLAREAAPDVQVNGRTAREVAAELGATG